MAERNPEMDSQFRYGIVGKNSVKELKNEITNELGDSYLIKMKIAKMMVSPVLMDNVCPTTILHLKSIYHLKKPYVRIQDLAKEVGPKLKIESSEEVQIWGCIDEIPNHDVMTWKHFIAPLWGGFPLPVILSFEFSWLAGNSCWTNSQIGGDLYQKVSIKLGKRPRNNDDKSLHFTIDTNNSHNTEFRPNLLAYIIRLITQRAGYGWDVITSPLINNNFIKGFSLWFAKTTTT